MQHSSLSLSMINWLKTKVIVIVPKVAQGVTLASLICLLSLVSAPPVAALDQCGAVYPGFKMGGNLPSSGYEFDNPGSIKMTFDGLTPNKSYKVTCYANRIANIPVNEDVTQINTDSSGAGTATLNGEKCFSRIPVLGQSPEARYIYVEGGGGNCVAGSYVVRSFKDSIVCDSSNIKIKYKGKETGCVQLGDTIEYEISGLTKRSGGSCSVSPFAIGYGLMTVATNISTFQSQKLSVTDCSARGTATVTADGNQVGQNITFDIYQNTVPPALICHGRKIPIQTAAKCDQKARDTLPDPIALAEPFRICAQIPEKNADGSSNPSYEACVKCTGDTRVGDANDSPQIKAVWTAVGCIKNDPQSILVTIVRIGLSVSGGVSLLMLFAASFTLATAGGDPKRFEEGKTMIGQVFTGLIYTIMSGAVLQFAGVQIFQLPGFGKV